MRFSGIAFFFALLLPLSLFAQVNEDYELAMEDVSSSPGESFTFEITVDNTDGDDLQGWQFGVCHDIDVLELLEDDIDTSSQDDFGLDWTFYSLSYSINDDDVVDGWYVGGLLNVITGYVVEPGANVFYEPTYSVLEDTDASSTTIEWCETLGDPTINVRMIAGTMEHEPVQVNAEVTLVIPFLRGDVDGDGSSKAMLDALALLEWGFLDAEEPPCMDAADVNDSGIVEPLEDTIFLAMWMYSDGPEPPAPGPDDCGGDSTDDDLGCDTGPDC